MYKPQPKLLTITLATNVFLPEPSCYKDAQAIPKWEEAMRKVYEALLKNNTWTLVALSPKKKTIGSK